MTGTITDKYCRFFSPQTFQSWSDKPFNFSSRDGASLRTDTWRYNRWGENANGSNEELYDHDNDPREFHNLVRDPAYQDVLEVIRARFEEFRQQARTAR